MFMHGCYYFITCYTYTLNIILSSIIHSTHVLLQNKHENGHLFEIIFYSSVTKMLLFKLVSEKKKEKHLSTRVL